MAQQANGINQDITKAAMPKATDKRSVLSYIGVKKLDWYIIKKFLSTFFFAIMVLAVISCLIDYSEKSESFVTRKAPAWAILNYYKDFIPHITALLFPLFIFIATIFFTSQIAYKSEIIAILAGGVSYQRFLRPYIIGGGFLCTVSLIANHWLIPIANKERVAFEIKYVNDLNAQAGDNIHLGIAKDTYIYMHDFDVHAKTGNKFTAEKIVGTHLKEKLMADNVRYDSVKKTWHLHNVVVRTNDSLKENIRSIPDLDVPYPFVPNDLNKSDAIKEALTTPELTQYIESERLRGRENLSFYYVEKDRRTAQPFAGLILTLIGACIASRKVRGGSGVHLAMGIGLCALYIMFLQLSTTFATKANLNSTIAVWIPNAMFAVLAFVLYRRQVK